MKNRGLLSIIVWNVQSQSSPNGLSNSEPEPLGPRLIPFEFLNRYYETDAALRSHWRSKIHKRRCKQLREPAYTIEESERAAGLGRETRRPTTTDSSAIMIDSA